MLQIEPCLTLYLLYKSNVIFFYLFIDVKNKIKKIVFSKNETRMAVSL